MRSDQVSANSNCMVFTRFTRHLLDDRGVIFVQSNVDILTLPPEHPLDNHETASLGASQDATNMTLAQTAHTTALETAPCHW